MTHDRVAVEPDHQQSADLGNTIATRHSTDCAPTARRTPAGTRLALAPAFIACDVSKEAVACKDFSPKPEMATAGTGDSLRDTSVDAINRRLIHC